MSLSAPTCFGACCSVVSSTLLSSRACSRCKERHSESIRAESLWWEHHRACVYVVSGGCLGTSLVRYWVTQKWGEESSGDLLSLVTKFRCRERERKKHVWVQKGWAAEGERVKVQRDRRSEGLLSGKVGQLVWGSGQLAEAGSGLVGGLTEPCCPSYPHVVLVPLQPDTALVLDPVCNWFLSLHLQRQRSSTRREF